MSDFLYIDPTNRVNIEKLSQANISKGLYNNYQIGNSCLFNSSSSQYLSRTPSSAGNRKTWTWSGWIKIGKLSTERIFLSNTDTSGYNGLYCGFRIPDSFEVGDYGAGSWEWQLTTTQLFRDTSSWYHIVVSVDTTQSTASNRVRIYLNGSQITSFSTSSYPSQNSDLRINSTSPMSIGRVNNSSYFFDGYLTEIHFIDGQALTPSSFGYFDNQRDFVWKPKRYIGSYGVNGFYLNFNNSSSLGLDSSGNNNNFTLNGSMSSTNQTTDSPSNNYCTLNPLEPSASGISNANLRYTGQGSSRSANFVINSGKWYLEATVSNIGGSTERMSIFHSNIEYRNTGQKTVSGVVSNYGSSFTTGDIIGVAINWDNMEVTFYKNNVSQGTLSFSSNTLGYTSFYAFNTSDIWSINFGQRSFTYTPPAGFRSLCTANLPVPSIKKANQFFDVRTYIGNGTQQAIRGISFSPNFVWIKSRSQSASNGLHDILRITSGGDESILYSDLTSAESIPGSYLSSFDSDGFTVNNNTSGNNLNSTYVSWQWGGANTQRSWNFNGNLERSATISIANPAVVNMTAHRFDRGQAVRFSTTGSLPSPISPGITYYAGNIGVDTFNLYDTEANAILGGTSGRIDTSSGAQSGSHTCRYASLVFSNQDSGFSIVGYIGNTTLSARNVGHGLNKTPQFIIIKAREAVTSWPVYHVSRGATKWLLLNSTSAENTTNQEWNNTEPNSITFSIGNSSANSNQNSKYIAYCWTEVEGYSKIGSFTGNGLADGAFVYTGFRPRFILLKNAQNAYHWNIFDTSRNTFNVASTNIHPSDPAGDQATASLDILSNGFKLRTASLINDSSNAIIYIAFAEIPFKYALAR